MSKSINREKKGDQKKQTAYTKLSYLAGLINIDPILVIIPMIIGEDNFARLVKTFAGHTITFPTDEEINRIVKSARTFKKVMLKNYQTKRDLKHFKNLFYLAMELDHKTVRQATKAKITDLMLKSYFDTVFSRSSSLSEAIESKITENNVLNIYKGKIDEIKAKSNIVESISKIKRIKKNKL